MTKQNIYLCQISAPYAGEKKILYLPYSVGLLWSYARLDDKIKQSFHCSFLIERKPIKECVSKLKNPKIVGFSSYVWNHNYNLAFAKEVKQQYPDCVIIFGGPSVSYKDKEFLFKHPYIDYLIFNEGELAFYDLLCNLQNRLAKKNIRGIGYLEGKDLINNSSTRIQDLDAIPSPYSEGLFDDLVKEYNEKNVILNVVLETNRGCPYSCTFCDWGNGMLGKVKTWDISKVKKELDWFGKNQIEFITVADANFGIYKQKDLDIAKYVVETKQKYDYPKFFHYTMSKQFFPQHIEIAKILLSHDLMRQFTVSLQDTNEDVLNAIKRTNISDTGFDDVYEMCKKENVPMATELMLGLPNQTYDNWMDAINRFHTKDIYTGWNPTSILPNTEMDESSYREKYGLQTETNVMPNSLYVDEYEEVIVGTNTMTKKDLNNAILHTYFLDVLHGHGFTDIIAKFYSKLKNKRLVDFYTLLFEYFIGKPGTLLFDWLDPLKNHVEDKKTYLLFGGGQNFDIFQLLGYTERKRFFYEMQEFIETIIDPTYVQDLITLQYYRQTHSFELTQKTITLDWDIVDYLSNDHSTIKSNAVYNITYKPIGKIFDTFASFVINGRFLKKWKATIEQANSKKGVYTHL